MSAIVSQITSLTIVYLTVYSCADHRIHQSSASLAFVRRIQRWPVNSPHKWLVTRKCFRLMTSSCICVSNSCLHRHYFYNPDTSPSPLQIILDRIWIPMAISPEVSPIDSVCQYHIVARTRYLTELNVTKETFWVYILIQIICAVRFSTHGDLDGGTF